MSVSYLSAFFNIKQESIHSTYETCKQKLHRSHFSVFPTFNFEEKEAIVIFRFSVGLILGKGFSIFGFFCSIESEQRVVLSVYYHHSTINIVMNIKSIFFRQ